jgi:hypothetical protein
MIQRCHKASDGKEDLEVENEKMKEVNKKLHQKQELRERLTTIKATNNRIQTERF